MALIIPYKYDVGQIIAPFKKDQPVLWKALDNLNTSAKDLNQIVGNIKALALYERIIFHIPVGSSGADLLRYLVLLPTDGSNNPINVQLNLTKLVISSQIIPLVDDVADIQVSNDRGVTWASILKVIGSDPEVIYDNATLVAGQTIMTYGSKQFARNTFKMNDIIRVDWLSGDSADNVEIDLIGNYQL